MSQNINKEIVTERNDQAKGASQLLGSVHCKELDCIHGLNVYDYSALNEDPTLGRFTTVDPLAEKYYSMYTVRIIHYGLLILQG